MFFVTLLLEYVSRDAQAVRRRACVHFDEVFGFPPTAEPPKRPLLTLMKQARSSDWVASWSRKTRSMDYKGEWDVVHRQMQTERDKDRCQHGLQDAISNAGGKGGRTDFSVDQSTDSRAFLMHNAPPRRRPSSRAGR